MRFPADMIYNIPFRNWPCYISFIIKKLKFKLQYAKFTIDEFCFSLFNPGVPPFQHTDPHYRNIGCDCGHDNLVICVSICQTDIPEHQPTYMMMSVKLSITSISLHVQRLDK